VPDQLLQRRVVRLSPELVAHPRVRATQRAELGHSQRGIRGLEVAKDRLRHAPVHGVSADLYAGLATSRQPGNTTIIS